MSELDALDYYALLGVARDATPDQIRVAFHRFAQLHHPDRHRAAIPDVQTEAQRWYRRGTEAYRVLMSPDQRRQYDTALGYGAVRLDTTQRAFSTRPTSPDAPLGTLQPRARPFLAKAIEAVGREEWASAKLNLQLVLQYDPDNEGVKAKLAEVTTRGLR